jgi:hypothetical protein
MTAQPVPLTPLPSVQVDPRRCDFDRLVEVDLELGRRVRDVLVADNLPGFLPDPSPETVAAARTCSGILIAGRAAKARRLAEIRTAWNPIGEAIP